MERPHTFAATIASRCGVDAASSSVGPPGSIGKPPRPSATSSTIFVAFSIARSLIRSNMVVNSGPPGSALGVLDKIRPPGGGHPGRVRTMVGDRRRGQGPSTCKAANDRAGTLVIGSPGRSQGGAGHGARRRCRGAGRPANGPDVPTAEDDDDVSIDRVQSVSNDPLMTRL